MEQNEVIYYCKASVYPPIVLVGIMMGVGMPVMMVGIFIHPIVAGVAMVASMFLVGFALTGSTVFRLNAAGLHRETNTSLKLGRKGPRVESHSWDRLQWFKEGKDRGKYTAEYRYLQLHFYNGAEWMITDNNGERFYEFNIFLEVFKAKVAERNQLAGATEQSHPETVNLAAHPKVLPRVIQQRKTIYESVWGKIFTIILGLVIVVFLFLHFTTSYINGTSVFKLYVVLIPGFIYMWYRVFREKK